MSESVVQCLKISIVKTLTDSPCGDELRRTRGYGSQFTLSKVEKYCIIFVCLFVLTGNSSLKHISLKKVASPPIKTLTDSPCGDELRWTRGYGI